MGNLRANFAPFGASVQQHPPRRRCSSIVVSKTPLQPKLSEAGGPFRPDVCNVSQRRRPHRRVRRLLWGSGFVSCRDLSVIGSFVKGLIVNGIKILETLLCTFNNLKSLKLFMHFCELPPILLMICFLRSAPNLEKLKILIYVGKEQKVEANGEFLNAQWTDGMCANLHI